MRKETLTMNQRAIDLAKVFIAGFVSTFVFHQGLFTLFYLTGVVPRAAYDFRPVPPLAVPSVISLAFWGGAWAVAIWPFLKNVSGPAYWVRPLAISAVASGSVALFIIAPLKGMPMAGGWNPKVILTTLMLNGAWGLGMAFLMRLTRASRDNSSDLAVSTLRTKLSN
jgi:hypothetical protein